MMEDFEMEPRGKGKERITLDDNAMTMIMKLAEGNPGACTVCVNLIKQNANIDPLSAFGEIGTLLGFDSCRIYSSQIWQLFKGVCKEDIVKVIALIRAWQFGFVSEKDIHFAIDNYGSDIDVDSLTEQVIIRLPEFWKDGRENFLSERNKKESI